MIPPLTTTLDDPSEVLALRQAITDLLPMLDAPNPRLAITGSIEAIDYKLQHRVSFAYGGRLAAQPSPPTEALRLLLAVVRLVETGSVSFEDDTMSESLRLIDEARRFLSDRAATAEEGSP